MQPEHAKAARWQHYFGVGVRPLAIEYGVNHTSMSRLLRGMTYTDAGGPIAATQPRGKIGPVGALNLRLDHARTGANTVELGRKYGISATDAGWILRGIVYPDAGGPVKC
jgi:hypothetical protein